MHPPEEHPDAVRSFIRCPFLANFSREATLPQQQFPVHGPAFDPEGCLEDVAVRLVAVHVVELEVMTWNQLVVDCGT